MPPHKARRSCERPGDLCFIWSKFPETFSRTLGELAFIFEEMALADEAVVAVEKAVHHQDMVPVTLGEKNISSGQVEVVEDVGNFGKRI